MLGIDESLILVFAAMISSGATLGAVWLRHRLSKNQKCDPIEKESRHNDNVYTALGYTMSEMGADRAYVMEFHNGIHYFSGRSQQKFSCSYEIVEEGISSESQNSQDYKVSNYHNYIKELVDIEKFEYRDIAAIDDHVFQNLLKHKGIQALYNVPIKTLNGKIIGILGVDYVRSPTEGYLVDNDNDVQIFMKRQARVIAGYLL
mgnify:CR=1 FL=1